VVMCMGTNEKNESIDFEKISRLIFEVGALKLTPRSGWFKVGIANPESVAEHSMRTAFISFIITYLETKDINSAAMTSFLSLIHDMHETRTTDLHRLSRRYVKVDKEKAFNEQLELLPDEVKKKTIRGMKDFEKYINDADKLELLCQAIEYSSTYPSSLEYVKEIEFETETAEKIAKNLKKVDSRWWINFE